MVHANAQGGVVFAANGQELFEAILQAFQFGSILLVCIFQVLKLSGGVDVVTGVDAYFFNDASGYIGHIGVEVYVGHKRTVVSQFVQPGAYGCQVLSFARSWVVSRT